ncbi:MAG: cell wall-binding repeat-containing protein, partial [Lachnospiraceae bacterium]|nr:cell wall-binding repeat-containing protein [Candidatus Equihabitans merdae]
MKKRLLALMISILMMLGMLPMTVMADENIEVPDENIEVRRETECQNKSSDNTYTMVYLYLDGGYYEEGQWMTPGANKSFQVFLHGAVIDLDTYETLETIHIDDFDITMTPQGSDDCGITAKIRKENGKIFLDVSASATASGSRSFRIAGKYEDDKYNIDTWTEYRFCVREPVIDRIAGAGRVETSFEAADMLKQVYNLEKYDAVVLANAWNFPDALSGSYLAQRMTAPLLLVDGGNSAATIEYVKNNLEDRGTIYILGGESAVPSIVDKELDGYHDCQVVRLSGNDRYETNLKILSESDADCACELVVASGKSFADSLSASAYSIPILMVDQELTPKQKSWLADSYVEDVFILGGEAAV